MEPRTKRLRQLVDLQARIKAIHEMRHAGHLRDAAVAQEEAEALIARAREPSQVADLFPDLYVRRIGAALARKDEQVGLARDEAGRIAAQTARGNIVACAYDEALRQEERTRSEKETLDAVSSRATRK